jgi:transglutaminase-like putative cysteine protease
MHIPGFSNQVSLGDIGEIKNTSRPAMHIQLIGREVGAGLKWRGGTLIDFDGRRWSNPNPARLPIDVQHGKAELEPKDNRQRGISYRVEFDELETDSLFFAGTPLRIYLRGGTQIRSESGNYRLEHIPASGFRYEAYSLLDEPPETAPIRFPTPILSLADRERSLQLPRLDSRISRLAHEVTAGAATDLERARALERYLRTEFGYTLELPSREVADPLAYFLFSRRKGHCEYFASSLAVMLRNLGIPARLATGFQSGIYNPLSDLWLIRSSDAHSWVEAWIPGHGWATFDPTPPDPNSTGLAFLTKLGLYVDAAETFWQQWVVGYDSGQQLSLVDQLQQGARHLGIRWFDSINGFGSNWGGASVVEWCRRFAIRIVVVVVVGVWIWWMGPPIVRMLRIRHRVKRVRRGEASVADATLLYERMLHLLKRRGYHKPAWFTPAEFAASLPRSSLGSAVSEFTVTYNALRFGGRTEAGPRLSILLEELERRERRA